MPRTFATATTLAIFACCAACSSSSGGGGDAGIVDVVAPEEGIDSTAEDASEEEAESSPVYGCSESQLAYATNMACGQCVAQNCAALLKACTNCVSCEMQLSGCPMCVASCFGRMAGPAFDAGP